MNSLDDFLTRNRLAPPRAARQWVALTGGVSSDIWRVDIEHRDSICVKRALATLKTASRWEAPVSRNAYEWAWMQFAGGIVPDAIPRLLAHDPAAGLFAMEYLPPATHPVWKQQLLTGHVNVHTAGRVGAALGLIHQASANRADIRAAFDNTAHFNAIRLEPYLMTTAIRHPSLAKSITALVKRTKSTRLALVHGDVSPKNILVGPRGPVLLDAECAWYGDPAFDVAFCLNHLLLKYAVRQDLRTSLSESFSVFAREYFAHALFDPRAELEHRAATLLPVLLLARIDGKSPVEYLNDEALRETVRKRAIALHGDSSLNLAAIADRWFVEWPQTPAFSSAIKGETT